MSGRGAPPSVSDFLAFALLIELLLRLVGTTGSDSAD